MVCHKLVPMTSSKPVLRVPTRTSDRMSNGFLWIILGLCLLNESSLVRLQHTRISHLRAKHASNESCCCWKSLRQCTLTTVSLLVGQHITGPHEEFLKRWSIPCLLTKFMSLFAYKIHGYLLWENLAAFQSLQLCSSLRCEQKCFMLPCSKWLWLCLSCK